MTASEVMWRQTRALRIRALEARLRRAEERREQTRAELVAALDARWRTVRENASTEAVAVVAVARDIAVLGRVWDGADIEYQRVYGEIRRALRAQAAPVPEMAR